MAHELHRRLPARLKKAVAKRLRVECALTGSVQFQHGSLFLTLFLACPNIGPIQGDGADLKPTTQQMLKSRSRSAPNAVTRQSVSRRRFPMGVWSSLM